MPEDTEMKSLRTLLNMSAACLALLIGEVARAEAPTPSDPTGNALGHLPGTFPTTVTAANVNVEQFTPASLDGGGSNNLRVSFPASGPIKWTESRHNEGDIALLIGPEMPNDASYYPANAFLDNYGPIANGPFENTTLAWRVNQQTGALLATVRHNGVNNGNSFTYNGNPVGTIHGIAYFNQTGAQGWGFRMNDGEFANGGNGTSDLQIGIAGFDDLRGESTSSVAVAYFPYEQGWVGAWVNGTTFDGEGEFASSSPELPTSTVNWVDGVATVQFSDVNSGSDGMLFVAPTHDNNLTNIAAAFPIDGGWKVAVREDHNEDLSGQTLVDPGQNGFQFLYVPYSAAGLVGGHVKGSDASLLHASGDQYFDVTRTAAGQYALSVYGADGQTKLTENDGMLILSVAGSVPDSSTLADRKFMSYAYDAASGNFIIQSRELMATNQPMPITANQFGDELRLRDVDFYMAWVSFTNPLQPVAPGIAGDYNDDGTVNAADYVAWRDSVNTATTLPNDTTPGMVTNADYDVWKANFGLTATGAAAGAASAVPEPASLIATLWVTAIGVAVRWKRRPRT